jgi:glycosyltransferase involved in cell wall biosynthesis
LVGRLADAVIVASDHSGQALEREGVPKSKIVVVRNGLPDKTDRPSSDAPNGVVGKPRLGADLIVVAMLRPEKGLDVAIDALPHVLAERADARLSIAGGVDNQQAADVVAALRERVARLGIQDRVDFLGRRSDVDRLLSEADVALLSSHVESMPMAMLEYMEAGVPIVATNVGGVPEMVRDGIEALLVPPNDPEALARGILEVLADPSEAATRAAAAQRRRSETFSLTQAAAEVTALYSRCDGASGN